ncbi:nup53p [Saccharomyces arboricola H-6]|uniref:Nup53p n=1 Tax=Saccharomyces arboricola (strain H-6 / AS 2.3317 / CBS 10644) TaxID=1160507 RepID=J8Q3K4_SACAR|nr:nup53p [Saccharomyces arboricola H-6]
MIDLQSQENTSRFTNVSVIAPESQGQQQQQQQQGQQKQAAGILKNLNSFSSVQQSIFTEDPPSTASAELSGNPAWFNNPRKRAIPNPIIKRSIGQSLSPVRSDTADTPTTFSNSNGFNNVTFGSKKDPRILKNASQNDNTNSGSHNHDLSTIVFDSNEAPPTTSLTDWQKEDGIFANNNDNAEDPNLTSNITLDGKLTDPSSPFNPTEKTSRIFNLFDKNSKVSPNKGSNESKVKTTEKALPNLDDNAVIIFGYPESFANSIILHFANFGEILEDFKVIKDFRKLSSKYKPASRPHSAQKCPIYTGDDWVKVTYDSQVSKSRALQENGIIMNGTLIGCVPYSPAALKQLASLNKSERSKNNNTESENSSNLNDFSSYIKTEKNYERAQTTAAVPKARNSEFKVSKNTSSFKNPRRLEIKDGRSLFLRNRGKIHSGVLSTIESDLKKREQTGSHKNSWLNRLNNWLFGWNDL